jgi:hypothetical protein
MDVPTAIGLLWAIWPKENAPGFDLSPFHAQSGSEYLPFFRVLTLFNGLTLRSSFPRVRESLPCFIFTLVRSPCVAPAEKYAAKNSFVLKAQLAKASMKGDND